MFPSGTHVKVRRRMAGLSYWHHGIRVDDSDVIEFGDWDWRTKTPPHIRKVPLECFAREGSVEPQEHPITWSGLTYSPQPPPAQVVDRAKWLLANQPPPYQLGFRNCESIAIWCATGDFESFQAKAFMRWKTPLTLVVSALLSKRPKVAKPLAYLSITISMLTAVPYLLSRSLFDHTRRYPGIGNWTPLTPP